ncbi:MAG: competence/damage-inducible protein A [Acidobacteria bacterium]|nr:competence/damage-inducible protein A [Acidobacteriota bacterium]MBV9622361.1 competence/damage-inducible protein A [Acidobacteriota bacterium]
MIAEIIAVGSELLTPFRQDTNSLYLTAQLNSLGVEVEFKTIVGDRLRDIVRVTSTALSRADVLFFSGGLGPTEDDLTREAVAETLGLGLRRDAEILESIERRFAERGWKMSANNAKQADVINGATVLRNDQGTAPGQWISGKANGEEKIIVLLPGPPHELKSLFESSVLERLRARVPKQVLASRVLKITGMGESACDARVAPIYKRYPDVSTTILAVPGEIQLHVSTRTQSAEAAEERLDKLVGDIEGELGDYVYSDNGDSLEQIVNYYLQMRNATIAVAESCTGGLVAERLTSITGSSRSFIGGAVVYSDALKTHLADVPADVIDVYGAVSEPVARALAEGIRKRCGCTLGLGITGVAGPTGGTAEKPVGLVFHALAGEHGTQVVKRNFAGDRARVRWFASQQALDMVRRKLM